MGRKKNWRKPKWPRESRRDLQDQGNGREFDPSTVAEVESLFKKHFTYQKPTGEVWELPTTDDWFRSNRWVDPTLMELRERLNAVKGSLSHLNINQWHEHTQATNRAGATLQFVRRTRKPELCTQAWCKFHEIVASFPIVTGDRSTHGPESAGGNTFNSVHLCEAPGAFIASLNHYLQTHGAVGKWQWIGNTLNPYHEANHLSHMIADDRLILETLDHWCFGADNTGDIMNTANIEYLQQKAAELGPIHLVTADGSVDCQNQPENQEMLVSPLHYCEAVTGLLMLAPGGSLVLKMFTLLEDSSVCLLYLLNCTFSQVDVFKPATSKSGNSEVYVICIGFKGMDEPAFGKLKLVTGPAIPDFSLFPLELLPQSFLQEHLGCCELFVKLQIQTIEENKALHGHMTPEVRQRLNAVRACCASTFIERYQVRALAEHQYIGPQYQTVGKQGVKTSHQVRNRKQHGGSFIERQVLSQIPWHQKIQQMSLYDKGEYQWSWLQSQGELEEEDFQTWSCINGQGFTRVLSSPFCDSALLQLYNQLLDHHQMEPPHVDVSMVVKETVSMCMEPTNQEQLQDHVNVVVWDSDLGPVARALQNMDTFKVSLERQSEDMSSFKLILAELGYDCYRPDISEMASRKGVLESVISIYKVARPGDHCVFTLPGILTRFSVGLLFLIHTSFEKLLVMPAGPEGFTPLYVLGQGHKGHPTQLCDWLQIIVSMMTEERESAKVLQLTPIECLLETSFYSFVSRVSEGLVKMRTNHMISAQQQLFGPPEDNVSETQHVTAR